MQRRTFLGAVGSAVVVASAGYGSGFVVRGRANRSANGTSNGDSVSARWFVGTRSGVKHPDQNRPHRFAVANETPTRRRVTIEVVDPDGEVPILDESVQLDPDNEAVVELLTPTTYGVTVHDHLTGRSRSLEITRDWFDCNDSTTTAELGTLGGFSVTSSSTLLACSPENSGFEAE